MTNAVSWERPSTGYIFPWTVVNLSKMISRAVIPLIKGIPVRHFLLRSCIHSFTCQVALTTIESFMEGVRPSLDNDNLKVKCHLSFLARVLQDLHFPCFDIYLPSVCANAL
jgi:hypothetical protein